MLRLLRTLPLYPVCHVFLEEHDLPAYPVAWKSRLLQFAFTMDVYSHIISGMQEDAMALLDEVLPSGVTQSGKKAANGAIQ